MSNEILGKWATDAIQIGQEYIDEILYETPSVQEFLGNLNKRFLCASKGIGKTLVLKTKRYHLGKSLSSLGKGETLPIFVPKDQPFLDQLLQFKNLSKEMIRSLEDIQFSKRIWDASFRLSALSHVSIEFKQSELEHMKRMEEQLVIWATSNAICTPTIVFNEIVSWPNIGLINKFLDEFESLIERKYREIHCGIWFFIDKIDEACNDLSLKAWTSIQNGLIESAWGAMCTNNHIRIYATIRQEAFMNFREGDKSNIQGSITYLNYSTEELSNILDKLTEVYENKKTFCEYVGLENIKTKYTNKTEGLFPYLLRYTLYRPRDLVIIANRFSKKNPITEIEFVRELDRTASTLVVPEALDENSIFLSCLKDEEERARLFEMIKYNILSREEVIGIYYRFNNCDDSVDTKELFNLHLHPLGDLFVSGILGYCKNANSGKKWQQKFRQPYYMTPPLAVDLPLSDYYFIHPGLNELIEKYSRTQKYQVIQYVTIGHNCNWTIFHSLITKIQKTIPNSLPEDMKHSIYSILEELSLESEEKERLSCQANIIIHKKHWNILVDNLTQVDGEDCVQALNLLLQNAVDSSF